MSTYWRRLESCQSKRAAKTKVVPRAQTPAEDARPWATEATSTVQTERKEEEARRNLLAIDDSHQQRPNREPRMARSGEE